MLFSDVWSEHAALFKRLMKIYSNPPILYYGSKQMKKLKDNLGYIGFLISEPEGSRVLKLSQLFI